MFEDFEESGAANQIQSHSIRIINMLLMFIFLWQSTFRVSDVGIDILLGFLSAFMIVLAKVLHLEILKEFALEMPKSAIAGRRVLGTNVDGFSRWVCCCSCRSIYPVENCKVRLPNGEYVSKKCPFIKFPNHPQNWRRKPCGMTLMKSAKTSAGSIVLL